MRIAVDARELCGKPTGVGRYLAGLLEAWTDDSPAQRHQWTLYAHARPALPGRWNERVSVIAGNGGTAWEQLSLPKALRAQRPDIFFAPGYTAPLTVAAPLVLTVHDVSFFAHREWFARREGTRRRLLTAWSARRARKIITDTAFSKAEIVRHIGVPASRIIVIPLGITPAPARPPVPLALGEPSQRPSRGRVEGRDPVVLYVGSVFERRRVDRLIAAFDHVADAVPGARLEIVGENRTRHPRRDLDALRRNCRHADAITIRSYVDEATLTTLYGQASVFAFLSEYEGFGFPPLEALAAGVPPVLLDTAVARETCGPAARYVAADAAGEALGGAIAELLTNPASRRELMQHAPAVLSRYDWDLTAADTLKVIEEAARGR